MNESNKIKAFIATLATSGHNRQIIIIPKDHHLPERDLGKAIRVSIEFLE